MAMNLFGHPEQLLTLRIGWIDEKPIGLKKKSATLLKHWKSGLI